MIVGTKDFVSDVGDIFTKTKQPFVLLVLDGPQYSFRMGSRSPEDVHTLYRMLTEEVIPYIEAHL